MVILEKSLLNQEDIGTLRQKGDFILYGSGLVATEVVLYLQQFGLHLGHIMVEFHKGNPVSFAGIEVCTIMGPLSKMYSAGIAKKLGQMGYNHIININRT